MFKKALSVAALGTMVFASGAFAASMFQDVPEDHWAADAIMWADQKGLMSGDGVSFRPADSVNRAELAIVMQRMYKLMNGDEGMMDMDEEMMDDMYTYKVMNTSEYTLSPGLLVVHSEDASVDFTGMVVGVDAPGALEMLAEDGNGSALKDVLEAMDGVSMVYNVAAVAAGQEAMVDFMGEEGMMVSYLSMVVESNDGYVFHSGPVAEWSGMMPTAHDAGTEMNEPLGSGCEGGQPGDCNEDQMGEIEDPAMAVSAHEQLTDAVAELSVMMK